MQAQRERKICYHAMKAYKGNRGITPPINFAAWRRWVIIFTSQPLCPQTEKPQYLWRLGFASEVVWAILRKEKSLTPVGFRNPDRSACNVSTAVYGKCVLCGAKIKCKHHWKYLGLEGRVILRRILEKWNKNVCTALNSWETILFDNDSCAAGKINSTHLQFV